MDEGEPLNVACEGARGGYDAYSRLHHWWRRHRNHLLVTGLTGLYVIGLGVGFVATAGAVLLQYEEDDASALGWLDIVVAFAYWFLVQCFWLSGVRSFTVSVHKPRPLAAMAPTATPLSPLHPAGGASYGTAPTSLVAYDEPEVAETLYSRLGRIPSFIMVGGIQLLAIMSRLAQNCFFFAHSAEHADGRVIYCQLLCGCLTHLGSLQVALWMIQESHETANLIHRKLDVPVHRLLHTLPGVRALNARHAAQFQFGFTSLCIAACISTIWTTRNIIMSSDSSLLCMLYLVFPSMVDVSFCFIVALNCALPNTQIADLRTKLCMDFQAPGWNSADEAAWPVVRQRVKGLLYRGYEGIHVFGQALTLGTLTNITVGVGSVFGALIGLLSYVASRSPTPGLNTCQAIPECTAGGWRKIVPIMLLMGSAVLLTEVMAMWVVRGTWKRRMGVPKLPMLA